MKSFSVQFMTFQRNSWHFSIELFPNKLFRFLGLNKRIRRFVRNSMRLEDSSGIRWDSKKQIGLYQIRNSTVNLLYIIYDSNRTNVILQRNTNRYIYIVQCQFADILNRNVKFHGKNEHVLFLLVWCLPCGNGWLQCGWIKSSIFQLGC